MKSPAPAVIDHIDGIPVLASYRAERLRTDPKQFHVVTPCPYCRDGRKVRTHCHGGDRIEAAGIATHRVADCQQDNFPRGYYVKVVGEWKGRR